MEYATSFAYVTPVKAHPGSALAEHWLAVAMAAVRAAEGCSVTKDSGTHHSVAASAGAALERLKGDAKKRACESTSVPAPVVPPFPVHATLTSGKPGRSSYVDIHEASGAMPDAAAKEAQSAAGCALPNLFCAM